MMKANWPELYSSIAILHHAEMAYHPHRSCSESLSRILSQLITEHLRPNGKRALRMPRNKHFHTQTRSNSTTTNIPGNYRKSTLVPM